MNSALRETNEATTYPVRWVADNIGLTGRDEPIAIELHMADKQTRIVALHDVLAIFDALDSYGRNRVTRALAFNAENGYLCAEDLAAWQHWCLAHPKFRKMY